MDSEMKLNSQTIKRLREQRSWSQEHLASAAASV
jgi:transcriptional regulator with XRE-family HTH domain